MAAKKLFSLRNIGIGTIVVGTGVGVGLTAYQYYGPEPVVSAAIQQNQREPRRVKISELPIYGSPECSVQVLPEKIGPFRQSIQSTREVIWAWLDKHQETKNNLTEKLEIGKAHTKSTVDMLRSDQSNVQRISAIGGAGVLGVLLGYRGGVLRQSLYGSIMALTTASICYPEDTVNIVINKYGEAKLSVKEMIWPPEEAAPATKQESTENTEKKDS